MRMVCLLDLSLWVNMSKAVDCVACGAEDETARLVSSTVVERILRATLCFFCLRNEYCIFGQARGQA